MFFFTKEIYRLQDEACWSPPTYSAGRGASGPFVPKLLAITVPAGNHSWVRHLPFSTAVAIRGHRGRTTLSSGSQQQGTTLAGTCPATDKMVPGLGLHRIELLEGSQPNPHGNFGGEGGKAVLSMGFQGLQRPCLFGGAYVGIERWCLLEGPLSRERRKFWLWASCVLSYGPHEVGV